MKEKSFYDKYGVDPLLKGQDKDPKKVGTKKATTQKRETDSQTKSSSRGGVTEQKKKKSNFSAEEFLYGEHAKPSNRIDSTSYFETSMNGSYKSTRNRQQGRVSSFKENSDQGIGYEETIISHEERYRREMDALLHRGTDSSGSGGMVSFDSSQESAARRREWSEQEFSARREEWNRQESDITKRKWDQQNSAATGEVFDLEENLYSEHTIQQLSDAGLAKRQSEEYYRIAEEQRQKNALESSFYQTAGGYEETIISHEERYRREMDALLHRGTDSSGSGGMASFDSSQESAARRREWSEQEFAVGREEWNRQGSITREKEWDQQNPVETGRMSDQEENLYSERTIQQLSDAGLAKRQSEEYYHAAEENSLEGSSYQSEGGYEETIISNEERYRREMNELIYGNREGIPSVEQNQFNDSGGNLTDEELPWVNIQPGEDLYTEETIARLARAGWAESQSLNYYNNGKTDFVSNDSEQKTDFSQSETDWKFLSDSKPAITFYPVPELEWKQLSLSEEPEAPPELEWKLEDVSFSNLSSGSDYKIEEYNVDNSWIQENMETLYPFEKEELRKTVREEVLHPENLLPEGILEKTDGFFSFSGKDSGEESSYSDLNRFSEGEIQSPLYHFIELSGAEYQMEKGNRKEKRSVNFGQNKNTGERDTRQKRREIRGKQEEEILDNYRQSLHLEQTGRTICRILIQGSGIEETDVALGKEKIMQAASPVWDTSVALALANTVQIRDVVMRQRLENAMPVIQQSINRFTIRMDRRMERFLIRLSENPRILWERSNQMYLQQLLRWASYDTDMRRTTFTMKNHELTWNLFRKRGDTSATNLLRMEQSIRRYNRALYQYRMAKKRRNQRMRSMVTSPLMQTEVGKGYETIKSGVNMAKSTLSATYHAAQFSGMAVSQTAITTTGIAAKAAEASANFFSELGMESSFLNSLAENTRKTNLNLKRTRSQYRNWKVQSRRTVEQLSPTLQVTRLKGFVATKIERKLVKTRLGRGLLAINGAIRRIVHAIFLPYRIAIAAGSFLFIMITVLIAAAAIFAALFTLFGWKTSDDPTIADVYQSVEYLNQLNDQWFDSIAAVAQGDANITGYYGEELQYTKVTGEFYNGDGETTPYSDNRKLLLAMSAVYFGQEMPRVEDMNTYLSALFQATHRYSFEVGELYQCSGCAIREYKCNELVKNEVTGEMEKHKIYNENGCDGKGGCKGHREAYCKGHVDAILHVTVNGYEEKKHAFSKDPYAGTELPSTQKNWEGWTDDMIEYATLLAQIDYSEQDHELEFTYQQLPQISRPTDTVTDPPETGETGGEPTQPSQPQPSIPSGSLNFSLRWPVPASHIITSRFGPRPNQPVAGTALFHRGLDIAAPAGTQIVAAASGVVTYVGNGVDIGNAGCGNQVWISHGHYVTMYNHCSVLLVSPGQQVSEGQVIALVGSTGLSTGPHLDFRLYVTAAAALYDKVAGDYLDPETGDYLNPNDMSGTRYSAGSISYH